MSNDNDNGKPGKPGKPKASIEDKRKARHVAEVTAELRRLVRAFCVAHNGVEVKPDANNRIISSANGGHGIVGGQWALETQLGRWYVNLPSDPLTPRYVAIRTHFDDAKRAETTGLTTPSGRWDHGTTVNPTIGAKEQAAELYASWLELITTRRVLGLHVVKAKAADETTGGNAS
jgi:hypothetical protein